MFTGKHQNKADQKQNIRYPDCRYVFSASIFDHELNDHYVTIEGEERRYRDQVVVTDHLKYCKGSRFYELNELIRHQQDEKLQMMMEEYAAKTMMVQFIKPMTEE